MKGIYSKIASTVYAHAVHMSHPEITDMMRGLEFEEIETSLNSIWHVYEQIWQMYENGARPNIELKPYPYKKEVLDSVIRQVGCEC